ncbi:MAG: FprA family A-type flavoprotein [Spirochaetes bacterium]|nr:FprA family A-type flavoprotein [Spirochaetota bacterium]
MLKNIEITKNIYWTGVNDHETYLFESLWPIPEGISYNSYLIIDKKTVLIDLVKQAEETTFIDNIKELLKGKKIDYLIINHMEPDHSGALKMLVYHYPDIKIIGNEKTLNFVKLFYDIESNLQCINDNDKLSLGDYEFQFFFTPMVHWPESMVSYETKNQILFSSDIFGGFKSLDGGIFDHEINLNLYESEIRRYFSNVIGKYYQLAQKCLAKLKALNFKIIAPAHGPVYRENPGYIMDLYDRWSRLEAEKGVVIAYASMYGNTQVMAETIARSLSENGIKEIKLFDIAKTDRSYIINEIWKYNAFILGACTYNADIFPDMYNLLFLLESKKMVNKYLGIFGSFSWSAGALKRLKEFAEKTKLELVAPMPEAKCKPTDEILKECELLGKNVALKILG